MASEQTTRVVHGGEGFWLSWLGNPVRYLVEGEHTSDTYAFSWGSFPPGDGHPQHRHDFEEGFYVLEGELTFNRGAGESEVTIGKGGFVNIGSGVFHHLQNTGDTTTEFLTIVANAGFERFHREAGRVVDGPTGPFDMPDAEELARIHAIALRFGIDTDPLPTGSPGLVTIKRPGEGKSVALIGDAYRFLAVGEETNGRYGLWEAVVPVGGVAPAHVQTREQEGFYLLEGDLTFQVDGQTVEAHPGTFVNVPPGCVHSLKNVGECPARMLVCVAPAGLEQMFIECGTPFDLADRSAPIPTPNDQEIGKLLGAISRYGLKLA